MQDTTLPGHALERFGRSGLKQPWRSDRQQQVHGQVTLSRIKLFALLVMLGGYLVLNYGFLVVRIPPVAAGVPLRET